MICRVCNGDGVCIECDGLGKCIGMEAVGHPDYCDECEGDGKCVGCDGTGFDSDVPEFLRRDKPNDKDKARDRWNRRHRR